MSANIVYDYIIVGSGFGGSVSAMRLSEKGYKCLVLEKGKRRTTEELPKSDWDAKNYLWMPALRWFGMMRLSFFKEVLVISGTGVGGGSLIYANTHLIPHDTFFNNPAWIQNRDWKAALMPFYEKAKFMLGTMKYDRLKPEDDILREVAKDMGREHTFGGVSVGVYYGDTQNFSDPYFKGLGPERKGCIECAGCMTGCRYHAKNSLDKNYLYFAEKFGAEVRAETLVTQIEYKDGIYHLHTESSTGRFWNKQKQTFLSKGLVVSAGVLGTMELLLKQKHVFQTLPNLSNTLGENLRTNSESITGLTLADTKLNNSIAISSYFSPDEDTHVEIVKYKNNSGLVAKLAQFATDGSNSFTRTLQLLGQIARSPLKFLKILARKNWGSDSLIILVMQSLDNALKMEWKKGILGGGLRFAKNGTKVPVYIPIGQDVLYRYAKKTNAIPLNSITESVFNMSTTAHILGGCPMGSTEKEGVIDDKFRVHGYPNMYILDGSIIPGNLGVNPSLTITALSEYAMAQVPEKEGNTQKTLLQQMQEITAK